ncbi:MAG: sulfotransferase, partial [Flavobacteriales bacterium]
MRKPNLFLVGAPKAGSSLLWTMLKEHKDIFFSTNPEKEINYFSYDELTHNSYYKDYKVKSEYDYLKVFKKGQSVKYLVDGSVSYFAYPSIPKKLYEFNSDAKIIVIVRDPILRAFSHYNMDKRMGYVT